MTAVAYPCRRGDRECDGCGACRKETDEYQCPVCGHPVDEKVYILHGAVVGCDQCIREVSFWEVGVWI